jgi:hypothetical protein
VSGQGLFALDLTFFAYLESVMRRTRQASDAEVQGWNDSLPWPLLDQARGSVRTHLDRGPQLVEEM